MSDPATRSTSRSALIAASYARCSTDLQRPTSISAQHRKNGELASRMGWQVVEEVSDAAVSGQIDDRHGLKVLLDRIRSGAVDVIVVESLDRLSRDPVDPPRLSRLAEYHDVEIRTLDKGQVTAVDVGLAGLLNSIQFEQTRHRTHRSLEEQMVKEG